MFESMGYVLIADTQLEDIGMLYIGCVVDVVGLLAGVVHIPVFFECVMALVEGVVDGRVLEGLHVEDLLLIPSIRRVVPSEHLMDLEAGQSPLRIVLQ